MAKKARRGQTDGELMTAAYGSIIVNDTNEKVFDCDMIESLDDTTIVDRIEINGDTVTNVASTYITTIGNTFPKGAKITGIDGDYFSAVTLGTAGAVNLVKKKPE